MMNKNGQGGIADTLTFTTPLSKNTLGEKSKPNGSDLKTQWERNQTPMGETPLKH